MINFACIGVKRPEGCSGETGNRQEGASRPVGLQASSSQHTRVSGTRSKFSSRCGKQACGQPLLSGVLQRQTGWEASPELASPLQGTRRALH